MDAYFALLRLRIDQVSVFLTGIVLTLSIIFNFTLIENAQMMIILYGIFVSITINVQICNICLGSGHIKAVSRMNKHIQYNIIELTKCKKQYAALEKTQNARVIKAEKAEKRTDIVVTNQKQQIIKLEKEISKAKKKISKAKQNHKAKKQHNAIELCKRVTVIEKKLEHEIDRLSKKHAAIKFVDGFKDVYGLDTLRLSDSIVSELDKCMTAEVTRKLDLMKQCVYNFKVMKTVLGANFRNITKLKNENAKLKDLGKQIALNNAQLKAIDLAKSEIAKEEDNIVKNKMELEVCVRNLESMEERFNARVLQAGYMGYTNNNEYVGATAPPPSTPSQYYPAPESVPELLSVSDASSLSL